MPPPRPHLKVEHRESCVSRRCLSPKLPRASSRRLPERPLGASPCRSQGTRRVAWWLPWPRASRGHSTHSVGGVPSTATPRARVRHPPPSLERAAAKSARRSPRRPCFPRQLADGASRPTTATYSRPRTPRQLSDGDGDGSGHLCKPPLVAAPRRRTPTSPTAAPAAAPPAAAALCARPMHACHAPCCPCCPALPPAAPRCAAPPPADVPRLPLQWGQCGDRPCPSSPDISHRHSQLHVAIATWRPPMPSHRHAQLHVGFGLVRSGSVWFGWVRCRSFVGFAVVRWVRGWRRRGDDEASRHHRRRRVVARHARRR